MTGILNKFYVEHGIHGARVMARSLELTARCTSDAEVDRHVQMLKEVPVGRSRQGMSACLDEDMT